MARCASGVDGDAVSELLTELKDLLYAGETPQPEDLRWLIRQAELATRYRAVLGQIAQGGGGAAAARAALRQEP